MGLFTRSNKTKKKQPLQQADSYQFHQSSPSLLGPPNVYTTRPPPAAPPKHHPQQPQLLPPPPHPFAHHGNRSQPQLQLQPPPLPPAGYLPPPPGWTPQQHHQVHHHQPVVVNQHYYIGGHPQQQQGQGQQLQLQALRSGPYGLDRLAGSVANLAKDVVGPIPNLCDDGITAWHGCGTQIAASTAAVYDQICSRFDDVMTLIDREGLSGTERDLFTCHPTTAAAPASAPAPVYGPVSSDRGGVGKPASKKPGSGKTSGGKPSSKPKAGVATAVVSGTYFSKVELYANSKLPLNLPPLALYIPTWPLLCLAAQYSQRVYDSPRGGERDAHVSADWRTGAKAMCIKSVPMDHMNTIVFAIRGTTTFMDWAVNLNAAPTSPRGFLDDPGNLCHAGFLSVARKMVRPVAARLRQMLQEDPGRSAYSLLITGHSAGGAVAALLYSHMLARDSHAESELNVLTGCFKRVHCVTFGTPPVSLLPLAKPDRPELRKSLFLSFVNEGDPVVRADKAYVRSLLELLASPPPTVVVGSSAKQPRAKKSSQALTSKSKSKANLVAPKPPSKPAAQPGAAPKPVWRVPPCTLSNAGRIVVLRTGDPRARPKDRKTVQERLDEGVVAATCREDQLRGAIWGDPVCHLMSLYAGRVETLAVGAVTAKGH